MKKVILLITIAISCLYGCRQGLDKVEHVDTYTGKFKDVYKAARKSSNIRSLVVSHKDTIVAERYFAKYSRDSLDHLRSVTKSVMATLIGIAIDQGVINNVDESIETYLGDVPSGKEGITIKHLLTMMSGIEWSEKMGYNDNNEMVDSGDPLQYVLDKPLIHKPGTHWEYSTGSTHLLSVILSKASGMSTLEFANKYLFHPLGIHNVKWQKLGDGYYAGGSRLELKPRHLIKIGQLYANDGIYNGKRILSESFIKEATSHHQPKDLPTDGDGYGYCWWLLGQEGSDEEIGGIKGYFAIGYGGQTIGIFPEIEVVITVTHDWLVNGHKAAEQEKYASKDLSIKVLKAMDMF